MLVNGDDLRVLVGRQHGGLAVYMRATIQTVRGTDIDVLLNTTGAEVKSLGLVDVPPIVRSALREMPRSPRLTLTEQDAQQDPPIWRAFER